VAQQHPNAATGVEKRLGARHQRHDVSFTRSTRPLGPQYWGGGLGRSAGALLR
jgi:hypothetical protein